MATELVKADYNDLGALEAALKREKPVAAIVQLARQKIDDSYSHEEVITLIKRVSPGTVVITDDNYAVMKVERIGAQCGADLSAFSLFKLLGPEGVGCVVGKRRYVEVIEKQNYSGGTQVQGHQAMAALRGLIQAPVALAIQSGVVEELAERLSKGEVRGVKGAFIANAQSKVLIVELERNNAEAVIAEAEKLGAAPWPVGSESYHEFVPMFYRVSGTFRASDPSLELRMIRVNPMRSGPETVMRILAEAMAAVAKEGK